MVDPDIKVLELVSIDEGLCSCIAEIYTSVGWGDSYSIETIKDVYTKSTYFSVAYKEHSPIGILRAFSDDVLTTWLAEIVVKKDAQNKRVGTLLLKIFLNRFKHTAIYTEALAGTENFFSKHGITPKEKL